jgi:hypothetical protein
VSLAAYEWIVIGADDHMVLEGADAPQGVKLGSRKLRGVVAFYQPLASRRLDVRLLSTRCPAARLVAALRLSVFLRA